MLLLREALSTDIAVYVVPYIGISPRTDNATRGRAALARDPWKYDLDKIRVKPNVQHHQQCAKSGGVLTLSREMTGKPSRSVSATQESFRQNFDNFLRGIAISNPYILTPSWLNLSARSFLRHECRWQYLLDWCHILGINNYADLHERQTRVAYSRI